MADVSTPTKVAAAMHALFELPRTLMGGTKAMRKAGKPYLPKEEAESETQYDARLKRSTLFNGFRKTVRDMTGKVFDRAVELGEDVPEKLKGYAENIDLAGRHLNVFARDVFHDGLQGGISYILTDMPAAPQRADNQPATRADEIAAGMRPYLVHIVAENLIGWKSDVIGGLVTLTEVRIRECVSEPDGDFGEKDVEQIRVLRPGSWETWRKSDAADAANVTWVKHEDGNTAVKVITLAPVYINRTGFMTAEPPLEDLADINVAHWQSQSDQRNILHVARVPILFGAGFEAEEKIVVGAGSMTTTTNVNAKLTWVEHTGAAIDSGDKDLANLERQMQVQGLQLLISTPGKTATGENHDSEKENSPLAMMAGALEDAIEQSLGFMALYEGLGKDAGGSITVNKDYGIALGSAEASILLEAFKSGAIDQDTFLNEAKRRKFLSESIDNESVIEKTKEANAPPPLDAGPGKGMNLDK